MVRLIDGLLMRSALMGLVGRSRSKPGARATDGEALFVQQFANAANQQDFVMLVVATIASSFHRPQLRKLLLPVAQYMRFNTAQLADFSDGEVAFGWDGRQSWDCAHGIEWMEQGPNTSVAAMDRMNEADSSSHFAASPASDQRLKVRRTSQQDALRVLLRKSCACGMSLVFGLFAPFTSASRPRSRELGHRVALQLVLELVTGMEDDHSPRSNRNDLTRAGVAARPLRFFAQLEVPKA